MENLEQFIYFLQYIRDADLHLLKQTHSKLTTSLQLPASKTQGNGTAEAATVACATHLSHLLSPVQADNLSCIHAIYHVSQGGASKQVTESPGNKGFMLIISAKMQPNDQTSTGVE